MTDLHTKSFSLHFNIIRLTKVENILHLTLIFTVPIVIKKPQRSDIIPLCEMWYAGWFLFWIFRL